MTALRSALRSSIRGSAYSPLVGKWGAVAAAAPVIENQSLSIGSLTLDGAGGIRPAYTGTVTSWAISGGQSANYAIDSSTGYITPSSDGSATDADTFTVTATNDAGEDTATITISAAANTYNCASNAELSAILALSTATVAGKTIELRDVGSYTRITINGKSYGSVVTLTAESANSHTIVGVTIQNSTNVKVNGLRLSDPTTTTYNGVVTINGPTTGVEISDNEISGVIYDHATDYTVTPYPGSSNGVITNEGSGAVTDTAILNNYIHDVKEGITAGLVEGNFEASGNEIAFSYVDCVKIGRVDNFGTYTKVNDNYLHGGLAADGDSGDPHKDMIQFLGSGLTADWTGIEVLRNIGICEERGDAQLVFADDAPADTYYSGMTVKGNVMLTTTSQFGCFINRAKDCVVIGNTFVKQVPLSGEGNTCAVSVGSTQSSGTHKVWQNIAEAVTVGATANSKGNVALGEDGGTIAYTAVFDGPSFDPQSRAEVLAKYNMKVSGNADRDASGDASQFDAGAIGSGYVTFASASPGQSGVSIDTAYEAPTLSGVVGTETSDTEATIDITTDDHTGTIYWFISTSATPPTASNLKAGTGAVEAGNFSVTATGAQTTDNATTLSAETTYYVHAIHTNGAAVDSAIVTSSSFTTEAAAGYTSNAIDTNGTAYLSKATGPSHDAQGTWYFDITPQSVSGAQYLYLSGGRSSIIVSTAKLAVVIKDSANTIVYDGVSTSDVFAATTRARLYIAVDLTVPSISIKIDGSTVTMTDNTSIIAGNGLIAHSRPQDFFNAGGGTGKIDTQFAQVYFDPTQVIAETSLNSSGTEIDISAVGAPWLLVGNGQAATAINSGTNLGSGGTLTVGSATFSEA